MDTAQLNFEPMRKFLVGAWQVVQQFPNAEANKHRLFPKPRSLI
jgi:hypothetical protein